MHDRVTKGLLFLMFLALVLNAFVMLVQPSRAADGQVGNYAIVSYDYAVPAYKDHRGFHPPNAGHGFYRLDTRTGRVTHASGSRGMD